MITVTATPTKIRYQKDGFVILACLAEQIKELSMHTRIAVKGNIVGSAKSLLNKKVVFTGDVDFHRRYGYTVTFSNYRLEDGGSMFWNHVSGLNQGLVSEIVSKHGEDPSWLVKDGAIEKLSEIKGIKEVRAKKLVEKFNEYKTVSSLADLLAPVGVSNLQISRLFEHFGEKASAIIGRNPYKATEVHGIGFLKADELAMKMGIDPLSKERKSAVITFAMEEAANRSGDTVVGISELFEMVDELAADNPMFLDQENMKHFIIREMAGDLIDVTGANEWFALSGYYRTEVAIIKTFEALKNMDDSMYNLSSEKAVSMIEEHDRTSPFAFGGQQRVAVHNALTAKGAYIISGYAGTGKSTVSKAVIDMHREAFAIDKREVIGCALSGVAAERFKGQTGYHAETIHSVLAFDGKNFQKNAENKLTQKLVILDEAGMVGSKLFWSLLKAIDFDRTKMIILGDPAQLPPIDAGQPFIELIENKLCGHIELTEIFRQSAEQSLPLISQDVRKGNLPTIPKNSTDVFFRQTIKTDDRDVANKAIFDAVIEQYDKLFWTKPFPTTDAGMKEYIHHLQIITPRKGTLLGTENLNLEIRSRSLLSPSAPIAFQDVMPLSLYEKVIHLVTTEMPIDGDDEKTVRVANGQLGVVVRTDNVSNEVVVRYPSMGVSVKYIEEDIVKGRLGYAYALSIHKTQGAEFDNVIIPLTVSHFMMLNARLFYTGITRMKKRLFLIGEHRAFTYASTILKPMKRNTVLNLLAKV